MTGPARSFATATDAPAPREISVCWGSVEGYLQMISLRGAAKFNLYELLTDLRIECRFTEELLDEARTSLGHRVVVSGEIHKRGDDFQYVTVERIHRRPPSVGLPGFADIRALLADESRMGQASMRPLQDSAIVGARPSPSRDVRHHP